MLSVFAQKPIPDVMGVYVCVYGTVHKKHHVSFIYIRMPLVSAIAIFSTSYYTIFSIRNANFHALDKLSDGVYIPPVGSKNYQSLNRFKFGVYIEGSHHYWYLTSYGDVV